MNKNTPPRNTPCKFGVEVELLAPLGSNRKKLAEAIAKNINGSIKAFFHLDSEPSKVKGKPIFYHLTQAFEVFDDSCNSVAHCVDDITLQDTLNRSQKPQKGWYRIVSDDVRFLRLIIENSQADHPIEQSLDTVATLFGVKPEAAEKGVYRLTDKSGASIALAAPLPGERERPCEVVTVPLNWNDTGTLYSLLNSAKKLRFQLPTEGATHIHFDGEAFSSPHNFLKIVRFLHHYRLVLRRLLNTNLNCRRLGDWSRNFLELIKTDELTELDWGESRKRISESKMSKYCDFNIRNLIYNTPNKHTLEIRILPSTLDAAEIYQAIRLFHSIFEHIGKMDVTPYAHTIEPTPQNAEKLLNKLDLPEKDRSKWMTGFIGRYDNSLIMA